MSTVFLSSDRLSQLLDKFDRSITHCYHDGELFSALTIAWKVSGFLIDLHDQLKENCDAYEFALLSLGLDK